MATIIEDVPMSDDFDYEEDVEAELEVDELDPSDDELQAPKPESQQTPTSKKTSNTKPGQRVPGHSLLPASKIENMLQANGITQNITLSKEGLFMLSIATEEFVKSLAREAYAEAQRCDTKLVGYEQIALVPVMCQPEYAFLQEIIPRPMGIRYAMEFREQRLQKMQDEDPALGGYVPPPYVPTPMFSLATSTSASVSASTSTAGKKTKDAKQPKVSTASASTATARKKEAAAEKKEKARKDKEEKRDKANQEHISNGSTTKQKANKARSASMSSRTESASQRRSARNGSAKQTQAAAPSPLVNGTSGTTSEAEADDATEVSTNDSESPWTSQPIGHASNLLHGSASVTPFSRSASGTSSSTNPGRTIYSQTIQPD
ncbi:hypothetical protein FA15DRAFT_104171 [Coprinopsis marcescibilis]|uniref:Transcription factor CBF/NF-Y/archaeal histone domain-containing protein n=1 Tax=Coprinopsis marcescibilis TaxID=230819 RepID=A0A5C3L5E6_COPMA|nr:hypothetical protein FA15DRAFT_104171 [Coprinopsis marcescibilis]